MYVFDQATVEHLIKKIKDQLDKRQDKEDGLNLIELNFSIEEKNAIAGLVEINGATSTLEEMIDNLTFKVIDPNDFEILRFSDSLEPNVFYIVSNNAHIENASHIAFIDSYEIQDLLNTFNDVKVDKIEGKDLSEVDYTEDRFNVVDAIEDVSVLTFVSDSLNDDDAKKVLSAKQGKTLESEYLGRHKFEYSNSEEVIYGLTQNQVNMLGKIYSHSFINQDDEFASLKEISDAREDYDGNFHNSLSERIDQIEKKMNMVKMGVCNLEDIIEFYGVHVDFEEQTYRRIGKARGLNASDFDNIYPWSGMRRCNIVDGEIVAYEGEEGYIEDGSNGDVMVEIPKFYYKVIPLRTEPADSGEGLQLVEAQWMITNQPSGAFKVHPAFIREGREVDHIYIGAFESCIFDASTNTYLYLNEQQVNIDEDKLSSIINSKPCSFLRSNVPLSEAQNYYYNLTNNKGENYCLFDIDTLSAIQILFLIENESFDSQGIIGRGYSYIDTNTSPENRAINTGSDLGVTYREIENLWGNIWTYIDNIVIEDSFIIKIKNKKISYILPQSDGRYISRFGYDKNFDYIFLPTQANGSSSLIAHDEAWIHINNESRPLLSGGRWCDDYGCGLWDISNSNIGFYLCPRLQFYK